MHNFERGLLHEVWLSPDGAGELTMHACHHLGPDGDGARALLQNGAVFVWVFWSRSNFEAMSVLYEFMGYGTYDSDEEWRKEPYSKDEYERQRAYLLAMR